MRGLVLMGLVALILFAGCEDAVVPEWITPVPDLNGPAWLESPAVGHDPRAFVFEDLGPPGPVLRSLEVNQCVLHYRRAGGKYTPVPFTLEVKSDAPPRGRG